MGGTSRIALVLLGVSLASVANAVGQTAKDARLTLRGHTGGVLSVTFSPDGKRILSASMGEVKVWDAQSGRLLRDLQGAPMGLPAGIHLSSDGERIVVAYDPPPLPRFAGAAMVWDAKTGKLLYTLKGDGDQCWRVSPDGDRVVSRGDDMVKVWNPRTGKVLAKFNNPHKPGSSSSLSLIAFSPDGKRLLLGADSAPMQVCDATTGKPGVALKGSPGPKSVAFSPDGKRLLAVDDEGWKVWNAETGKLLRQVERDSLISIAFSPDGKRIVAATAGNRSPDAKGLGGEVTLWDTETGMALRTFKGYSGPVLSLAFSPDGKRIASGSGQIQEGPGEVKVWEVTDGR